jgi:hypothetical protein
MGKVSQSKARQAALKHGYRSGLEQLNAEYLEENNVSFKYEQKKIEWLDSQTRTYTPDFELPNGIIIETKGRFLTADRRKHKLIQKQYPDLDIRFVFTNSRAKLYKGSKSTYGSWCTQHDFLYSDRYIPLEWIEEEKT